MRIHKLKILNDFADCIISGDKTFEIRENDRGFQKGDFIQFQAIEKNGLSNKHMINDKIFEIIFVLNGWGLENGYVALGIKESKRK